MTKSKSTTRVPNKEHMVEAMIQPIFNQRTSGPSTSAYFNVSSVVLPFSRDVPRGTGGDRRTRGGEGEGGGEESLVKVQLTRVEHGERGWRRGWRAG